MVPCNGPSGTFVVQTVVDIRVMLTCRCRTCISIRTSFIFGRHLSSYVLCTLVYYDPKNITRNHLLDHDDMMVSQHTRYRVVQKRILLRFKDRTNPAPLANLDTLLSLSYETLQNLTETIEEAEMALSVVSQHLAACTRLILLLIQYRFDLREDVELLRSYFEFFLLNENVAEYQNWEEVCELNLEHLLKVALVGGNAGAVKPEPFLGNGGQPVKLPPDLGKLKKKMTTVVDRLANGVRLVSQHEEEE